MSYHKRQALFKNMNPLLKKYHQEGAIPPQYIPKEKRAYISSYMGRSSYVPGNNANAQSSDQLKTTKRESEAAPTGSDYKRTLSQRIDEG